MVGETEALLALQLLFLLLELRGLGEGRGEAGVRWSRTEQGRRAESDWVERLLWIEMDWDWPSSTLNLI